MVSNLRLHDDTPHGGGKSIALLIPVGNSIQSLMQFLPRTCAA